MSDRELGSLTYTGAWKWPVLWKRNYQPLESITEEDGTKEAQSLDSVLILELPITRGFELKQSLNVFKKLILWSMIKAY